MAPCPRKLSQIGAPPMPRPMICSVCVSDTQLPRCNCQRVCTQDTCANSTDCLKNSPGPEFCPHGVAPEDTDECTGSCREPPPPPPPPCPVCAQHQLARAPSKNAEDTDECRGSCREPPQPPPPPSSCPVCAQNQLAQRSPSKNMSPCPKKLSQMRAPPMPRPMVCSACVSDTQLARCNCQRVCTQDTCANSADCLQNSPGQEYCPHGLAPEDTNGCTGSCREPRPPPPPPPCPVCAQHQLAPRSPSLELNQASAKSRRSSLKALSMDKLQSSRRLSATNSAGSICCSGSCPTSKRPSLTNASTDNNCCSAVKNSATESQPELPAVPEPAEDSDSSNEQSQPQDDSMANCCKSGKGIQSGPHMRSDAANQSAKGRRPSLVHISNGNQRRVSIKDQPEGVKSTGNIAAAAAGNNPDCQRSTGGLFPTPTAPCLCRMPPAFIGVCTGNLSGTCQCNECNKK